MKAAPYRNVSPPQPQRGGTICLKPFKLTMKTFKELTARRNSQRNDSRRPLIGNNNNNDKQKGYEQAGTEYDNPSAQNSLNTHEQRHLQSEEQITSVIAELLDVPPDANTSEDGDQLIRRYVSQHFPKPPADVEQNLYPHLLNIQETMLRELMKLGPALQSVGLIECYHCQLLDHLDDLLQNISSTRNSLLLMKWVLQTYLSPELLGHPDIQEMDPMKKADLLLFTEWVEKAKYKLLENVQKEVKGSLEEILQYERANESHDELYLDTIQCIDAKPKEALKISLTLSCLVREVCFQELLIFLKRYTDERTEILGKKAKMNKPETKHFFNTLNNCQELKQYVQTNTKGIKKSLLSEIVAELEDMETFTSKALMKIVADIATSHLKKYFKLENKEFFLFIDTVKSFFFFSEPNHFQDVKKRVMDDIYKLIVHIYLKHLIQTSHSKLRKCWRSDVGQTVTEDAELLHLTISELAPGVQKWNLILLNVKELLDCNSLDATKLIVGNMHKECQSEDLELLPTLLLWKGLSRWQVREVQMVLEDLSCYQPRPRSVCCFSCITW